MISALRITLALCVAIILCVASQPAAAQSIKGRAYLFRGLGGIFSMGMDELAEKLAARGIKATVYGYGSWPEVADEAAARSQRNRRVPIIIIGHSLGADAAIQMAERLTALGTPPRLVVTFDPVGVHTVGPARGRFINYFQSNNGYGKRLEADKSFRGTLVNRDLADDPNLHHFNIEKAPQLHAEILSRVRAITTPKKAAPRPKPMAAPAAVPAEALTDPIPVSAPETAPVPSAPVPDAAIQISVPAAHGTGTQAPM